MRIWSQLSRHSTTQWCRQVLVSTPHPPQRDTSPFVVFCRRKKKKKKVFLLGSYNNKPFLPFKRTEGADPCDYHWGSWRSQMRSILPLKAFSEQHTKEFASQGLSKATVDQLFLVLSSLFFLSWHFNEQSDAAWLTVCSFSGSIQKHLVCSFKNMLILFF